MDTSTFLFNILVLSSLCLLYYFFPPYLTSLWYQSGKLLGYLNESLIFLTYYVLSLLTIDVPTPMSFLIEDCRSSAYAPFPSHDDCHPYIQVPYAFPSFFDDCYLYAWAPSLPLSTLSVPSLQSCVPTSFYCYLKKKKEKEKKLFIQSLFYYSSRL